YAFLRSAPLENQYRDLPFGHKQRRSGLPVMIAGSGNTHVSGSQSQNTEAAQIQGHRSGAFIRIPVRPVCDSVLIIAFLQLYGNVMERWRMAYRGGQVRLAFG